jgi:sensor c-di-GMP phosphodiesterase-like protein
MTRIKRGSLAALLALVLLATALTPGLLCFLFAQHSERRHEAERLGSFADTALLQAEAVTRELSGALLDISRTGQPPCSPSNLTRLRRIALSHWPIRDAGAYDQDRRWQCSSLLGAVAAVSYDGFTLPPPDWQGRDGLMAWFKLVDLPGGKESLVLGRDGFYVAVDPASYFDSLDSRGSPGSPGARKTQGVGVINTDTARLIASNSSVEPSILLAAFHAADDGAGAASDTPYAVRRSSTMPLAVVVRDMRRPWLTRVREWPWSWLLGGATGGLALAAWLGTFMVRRLSPVGQLSDAVRRHQFIVAYQPIVDLATRRCIGAEALVRWKHQDRIVRPDHFIPLAEHRGLIQAITDQVLDTILFELGEFLHRYRELYVSINLSAPDLTTRRFLDKLTPALVRQRLLPGQIRIEATERAFLDADAAKEVIQAFRDAGHPVYIDDFGTGYSSLSHLQNFQVDALKIDKSFVDTVGQDTASSSVASHIIEMAMTLKVQVIAEGIEHEEQACYLHSRGAHFGQGWLFSAPLSAAEFIGYVGKRRLAV